MNIEGVIRLVLLAVAVFISAYILPGIELTNPWYALLVALVLSVVNVTVRPIIQVLTLPLTLFTLGLFLLVINALMVLLVDYLLDDFAVSGFWTAFFFSIVITLLYSVLDAVFGDKNNKKNRA